MVLRDTKVLSELRKGNRNPAVVACLEQQPANTLHLSVISVGEIERGIRLKRRHYAVFAQRLEQLLDELLRLYGDRILPINTTIARRRGQLSAELGHHGADLIPGATALEHGLQIATRHEQHFLPTGLAVVNPFSA